MDLNELIAELEELIAKYADGVPDDTSEETASADAERMTQLSAEIERISADQAERRDARNAAVTRARAAIEQGSARQVGNVPLNRSASGTGSIQDVTDYGAAERRAWVKRTATDAGIQLVEGNELTPVERTAFTHLTTNTTSVVPKEIRDQIITLIDNSAVLFGDVSRTNFKHQFELVRHAAIAAGDAAKVTTEGTAPTNDEQNTFSTLSFVGVEIKKTLKMSRKMAVQSMDGLEDYLISEISSRLSVAANAYVHAQLKTTTYGMAAAQIVACATPGKLAKADVTKTFAKVKTYGNAAPKGMIVYANANTIWNYIAMLEDANKRSYFVDERTEDPAVQGRIFGKTVKLDDSMTDKDILIGYPDLVKGNVFDGPDVSGYVATDGTQNHCFDGYLLYDCGLAVPTGFALLQIGS